MEHHDVGVKRTGMEIEREEEQARARARLNFLCVVLHRDPVAEHQVVDAELDHLIVAVSQDFGDLPNMVDDTFGVSLPEVSRWWEEPGVSSENHGLPPELVKDAMAKEIASFKERDVYEVVNRESMKLSPHPIKRSAKWVIKNKEWQRNL